MRKQKGKTTTMQEIYTKWKNNNTELAKLQWVYAVVTFGLFMIASMISLLDRQIAFMLLDIARLTAMIFAVNFVAWAVISSFVDNKQQVVESSKNSTKTTQKKKKSASKK